MRNYTRPEQLTQGVDLHKHGFSWRECGEMLGLNGASLRRAVMRSATPRVYTRMTIEHYRKARKLRKEGLTWKSIARQLNANWMTLYKGCRNARR